MNLRQHSREKVSLTAGIFINHIEYAVNILDLSFSGVLICIDASSSLYDEPDMFMSIQYSSVVDIYIENHKLESKAEIVRVSFDNENLIIGLKFKELENFNKRKSYRKSFTAFGQITLSEQVEEFKTVNVSDDGMMICLRDYALVNKGTNPKLKLEKLNLHGKVKVIWAYYGNSNIWLGLQL